MEGATVVWPQPTLSSSKALKSDIGCNSRSLPITNSSSLITQTKTCQPPHSAWPQIGANPTEEHLAHKGDVFSPSVTH